MAYLVIVLAAVLVADVVGVVGRVVAARIIRDAPLPSYRCPVCDASLFVQDAVVRRLAVGGFLLC